MKGSFDDQKNRDLRTAVLSGDEPYPLRVFFYLPILFQVGRRIMQNWITGLSELRLEQGDCTLLAVSGNTLC